MPRLAEIMISGNKEVLFMAKLLRGVYSEDALPYIRRGLRESQDFRIQLSCASVLAAEGEREAFQFFKDQIEAGVPEKWRIVSFVKDQFEVPGSRTDARIMEYDVLQYIESRLKSSDKK